jgi:hypothetical protein
MTVTLGLGRVSSHATEDTRWVGARHHARIGPGRPRQRATGRTSATARGVCPPGCRSLSGATAVFRRVSGVQPTASSSPSWWLADEPRRMHERLGTQAGERGASLRAPTGRLRSHERTKNRLKPAHRSRYASVPVVPGLHGWSLTNSGGRGSPDQGSRRVRSHPRQRTIKAPKPTRTGGI